MALLSDALKAELKRVEADEERRKRRNTYLYDRRNPTMSLKISFGSGSSPTILHDLLKPDTLAKIQDLINQDLGANQ